LRNPSVHFVAEQDNLVVARLAAERG